MTREELYSEIVGELIEQGYREYREQNEEIANLYTRLSVASDIRRTIKERLSAEEYSRFTQHLELTQETTSREIHESYINGAKDCVELLKKLGVI